MADLPSGNESHVVCHVRDALRTKIFSSTTDKLPATYLLKEKLEEKCPNLDIRLVTIEVSPNQLKQVLVITRVVKKPFLWILCIFLECFHLWLWCQFPSCKW